MEMMTKRRMSWLLIVMLLVSQLGVLPVWGDEKSPDSPVMVDLSQPVESSDVDMEALEAQDTYFLVRYDDGALEVRRVDSETGFRSMDGNSEIEVSLEAHIQYYESLPDVAAAEPLAMRSISGVEAGYTPNDTLYNHAGMWGLKWIEADRLFRMIPEENLEQVVVAVLDTGMDMDHPDLAGSLASVDISGVGTVHGYDVVNSTASIPDYIPDDGHINSHGTHVAGTIGAIADNALGVAGVAAGVKILPVKVLNDAGSGTSADVVKGIEWAADHGADIINMSLGGVVNSPAEQEAINYAVSKGVVVIAATGNYANNWSGAASNVNYPAAYDNVIAVASVGLSGETVRVSDFSNSGPQVDVAAPGEAILSTKDGDYGALSGTSMATPHVAGLAALIKATDSLLTPAQIEEIIKDSAEPVTPTETPIVEGRVSKDFYGDGVINVYAAIGEPTDTRLSNLVINGRNLDFDSTTAAYEMTWAAGAPSFELKPIVGNPFQSILIDGTPYVGSDFSVIPLVDGKKTVTVQVTAKDGNATGSYTIDAYRLKALGALPAGEVVMTGDNVRLSLDGIYDPGETLQLTIPDGNDDATLTVPITDNGTTITGALPQTAITKNDGAGTVSVSIPEGTTVSASTASGWDGTLSMPTVSTTTGATVTGGTANLAVTLGVEGTSLTFSKAIRIRIPGMAGKKVGYVNNGAVVEITRSLATDTQAEADAMPAGADGKISVGSDLVVWTKHLTEFVAYTPASVPSTPPSQSSGGGGGGGGSGVSRVIRDGAAAKLELDNITLLVPEGAYSKEYRIDLNMIRYSKSPFSAPLVPLTPVYGVKKTIRNNLEKPYTFSVMFEYDAIRNQYPTEQIRLYLLDETLKRWRPIESSVLSEKRSPSGIRLLVLSAEVSEFTEFAAIAEPAAAPMVPLTPEMPAAEPIKTEKTLTDIQTHWGRVSIEKLVAESAVSGYPDGTFRPDAAITRAEFLAILVKAQGMTGSTPSNFSDLNGHWAKGVIERAMAYGITGGYADGLFRPDAPITREEMAVMIDRSLRYASGEPLNGFTDGSAISAWARESLQRIVAHKIMAGYPDGSFRPQGLASRAEACSVILRTIAD